MPCHPFIFRTTGPPSFSVIHATCIRVIIDVYAGASSGFSIISEAGLKWIEDRTGSDAVRRMLSEVPSSLNKEVNMDASSWCRMDESDRLAMPSPDEAADLLNGELIHSSIKTTNKTRILQWKLQYPISAI